VDCIVDNGDGTFVAFFGYDNPNTFGVTIPIGPSNYFVPNPNDRGQPTTFAPGAFQMVFSVSSNGAALVWHLDGSTAVASMGMIPCPATPTPTETPSPTLTSTPTPTDTPTPTSTP